MAYESWILIGIIWSISAMWAFVSGWKAWLVYRQKMAEIEERRAKLRWGSGDRREAL